MSISVALPGDQGSDARATSRLLCLIAKFWGIVLSAASFHFFFFTVKCHAEAPASAISDAGGINLWSLVKMKRQIHVNGG